MVNNQRKLALFQKIKYNPTENQEGIHNSSAKIITLMAPSRSLKSTTYVPEALFTLLAPKHNIWVVGLDYSTTDRFIFGSGQVKGIDNFIREYFPWFVDGQVGRSKKDHTIKSKIGSSVKGKSVKYPGSFVAEPVDLIICEDASSFPDDFYDMHLRGRVLDTAGRIFINSVPPLRKNWVVRLSKAVGTDAFSWGLRGNPYLSEAEIESYIRDCPVHLRDAFVDGKISEEDSSVFGKIRDNVFGFNRCPFVPGHLYQGGVDIGRVRDRTVHCITDLTVGKLVFIDVFPPKFFKTEIVEARLMTNSALYGFPNTYVDVSGIGTMFMTMVEAHAFFIPYTIPTLKSRNGLIEELAMAFQRHYQIPDEPYLIAELENLEIVLRSNYHLYRSNGCFGDDTIIATALSIHGWAGIMFGEAGTRPQPAVIEGAVAEDSFYRGDMGTGPILPEGDNILMGDEYAKSF